MLNFFSRRNLIGGGIPANRTVLSVSWLGNQFSAVAVQRGRVAGTWQRSDASTELGEFGAMVRHIRGLFLSMGVMKAARHGRGVAAVGG